VAQLSTLGGIALYETSHRYTCLFVASGRMRQTHRTETVANGYYGINQWEVANH
jgi:hypothetical protein